MSVQARTCELTWLRTTIIGRSIADAFHRTRPAGQKVARPLPVHGEIVDRRIARGHST